MKQDIVAGCRVRHLGTGKVRTVSGVRGTVVHFSQVIKKENGRTMYWADANKVRRVDR